MSPENAMREVAQMLNVQVSDRWSNLMEPTTTSGSVGHADVGESNIESSMNSLSLPSQFLAEVTSQVRILVLSSSEGSYSGKTFTFDASSTTTLSTLLVVATKLLSPSDPNYPYGVMYVTISNSAQVKQQFSTFTVNICKYCGKKFWKKKGCCRNEQRTAPRGHTTDELNIVRQKMTADQYAWFSQQSLSGRRSRGIVKRFIQGRPDAFMNVYSNLLTRNEMKEEMLISYNKSVLSAIQSHQSILKLSTQVLKLNRVRQQNLAKVIGALAKQHGFEDFYSNSKYSQQLASPRFSYETLFTSKTDGDLKKTSLKYIWVLGQTENNLTYAMNFASLNFSSNALMKETQSNVTSPTTVENYNQLNISRMSIFTADGQFLNDSLLTMNSPWDQNTTRILLDMLRFTSASAIVPQRFQMLSDFGVEVISPETNFTSNMGIRGKIVDAISLKVQALASAVSTAAKAAQEVINVLKSSKSVTIERILRFGFSYFNQRSRILRAFNIPSSRVERFLNAIIQDYGLPSTDSFTLGVTYSDDFTWEQVNFLFSPAKNGIYRSITIYKNGDSTTDTASFFIVDINADYQIAPDLLLVTTSKSKFGGLFSSHKETLQEIPHVLTLSEADQLQKFFMLVAIGNMAQTMRVKTDLSKSLK